jgi:aryl-alcohol dehydrogenase-like predicted oxidoreductase
MSLTTRRDFLTTISGVVAGAYVLPHLSLGNSSGDLLASLDSSKYRQLGPTGIKLPAIGVGTLAWGDKRFGYGKSYTREDLFEAYKASLDAGVNFFDTSESYGHGLSEQLLGEFHSQDGRPIIVATKFSPAKIYEPSNRFSAKDIIPTLDGSLKRLKADSVDLYHLHYPVAHRKLYGYLDALAEAVKTGKAKSIGVSNFNVKRLRYAHEYLAKQNIHIVSNEIDYSLLYRHPETNGMLETCKELNVSLIAILPLGEGVLSGDYRVGGAHYSTIMKAMLKVGQLDMYHQHDSKNRIFTKPYMLQREKLEPLFVLLDEVAKAHHVTIAQVALNWILTSNQLVLPIPGPRNLKQAADNAATLNWKLTTQEFERISQTETAIRKSFQK